MSAIQLLGAITVLSCLLVTQPALAQSAKKKPTAEQSEGDAEARRLFKEGDKLYAEGDYEGAVRAFEKSYELSHQPALKYNLANAYERLARYEEALSALKEYESHAAADERDVVKRRIGKLQERADQQRAEKEKSAAQGSTSEPSSAAPPTDSSQAEAPNAEASVSSNAPVLGYVLVGGGAVGVGLGAYFGIQALSTKSDAETACKDSGGARRCPSSASDTLSANQRDAIIADVGIGVGIVAAAVGTFLIFKSKSNKETASTELRAAAGPHGGGLNLVGSF